jgi:hypothetical protein
MCTVDRALSSPGCKFPLAPGALLPPGGSDRNRTQTEIGHCKRRKYRTRCGGGVTGGAMVDQVRLPGGGASILKDPRDLESRRLVSKWQGEWSYDSKCSTYPALLCVGLFIALCAPPPWEWDYCFWPHLLLRKGASGVQQFS